MREFTDTLLKSFFCSNCNCPLQPERKSKQPVSGVQIVAHERKILRVVYSPFFPPLSTFFFQTPQSKRLEQAKQLNVSELMNLFIITVTNLPYIIHQLSLYLRSLYLYSGLWPVFSWLYKRQSKQIQFFLFQAIFATCPLVPLYIDGLHYKNPSSFVF